MEETLYVLDEAVVTGRLSWWQRHPVLILAAIAGVLYLLKR